MDSNESEEDKAIFVAKFLAFLAWGAAGIFALVVYAPTAIKKAVRWLKK